MKKDLIRIQNLEARRGEKVFDFLDVKDSFGIISQLPVGIINGTDEGPALLVTAGVHGCEYDGIEGATRLYRETRPEGLKGTLIIITCMNLPAFRMATPYVVPFDQKNLNWSFPGSATGSAGEVIAHVMMEEFLPKADYVVDCHGGDMGEAFLPMTICTQTDDEGISEKSKELANAFGLDWSYYDDARSGADSNKEEGPKFHGSWVTWANKSGVPAIAAEAGCDGRYEENDILIHVKGLKNVMSYLGIISGTVDRKSDKARTTYFRSMTPIKTESLGIFNPLYEPGERISKGQIVAEIKDLKGDVIAQVRSREEGLIMQIMTKRFVNNGDRLFLAFKLEE